MNDSPVKKTTFKKVEIYFDTDGRLFKKLLSKHLDRYLIVEMSGFCNSKVESESSSCRGTKGGKNAERTNLKSSVF